MQERPVRFPKKYEQHFRLRTRRQILGFQCIIGSDYTNWSLKMHQKIMWRQVAAILVIGCIRTGEQGLYGKPSGSAQT